MKRKQENIN